MQSGRILRSAHLNDKLSCLKMVTFLDWLDAYLQTLAKQQTGSSLVVGLTLYYVYIHISKVSNNYVSFTIVMIVRLWVKRDDDGGNDLLFMHDYGYRRKTASAVDLVHMLFDLMTWLCAVFIVYCLVDDLECNGANLREIVWRFSFFRLKCFLDLFELVFSILHVMWFGLETLGLLLGVICLQDL